MNFFDLHMPKGRLRTFTPQQSLEAEALKLGCICYRESPKRFSVMSSTGRLVEFTSSRLSNMPESTYRAALDKIETKRLLELSGAPTPVGTVFSVDDIDGATAFAEQTGYPVVIKPVAGSMGRGVYANLKDTGEFKAAFSRSVDSKAKANNTKIIVERHVDGRDFRIFASRSNAYSVIERIPAHIVGDGKSTIADLVKRKNIERQGNPYAAKKPISLETEPHVLSAQRLTADSVPQAGQRVALSSVANISRGGESIECLHLAHKAILDVAVQAIRAIDGLEYGGVDIIMEDPSLSPTEQKFAVIEINGTPDILMHPFPFFGHPVNVPAQIIRHILDKVGHKCPNHMAPLQASEDNTIFVHQRISGHVTGVGYRSWLRKQIENLELVGGVRNFGESVEFWVKGPAQRVAMLTSQCIKGRDGSFPAHTVITPLHGNDCKEILKSFEAHPHSFPENLAEARKMALGKEPASYVHDLRIEEIPSSVVDRARLLLLDTLGVMLLGSQHSDADRYHCFARSRVEGELSTVVGAGVKRSAGTAAYCGAALAQIHDYNDGHRQSAYHFGSRHPGRVIIPVALAVGEATKSSASEILSSIIVGYDIACKLRSGRYRKDKATARSDMYAAAAVAARLKGHSIEQIAAGMGLAGCHQPTDQTDIPIYEIDHYRVGLRAAQAIAAVEAADFGQLGPSLIINEDRSLPFNIGTDSTDFEVMNVYVKLWPACRMVSSAVEAALDLRWDFDFDPANIESIEIRQPPSSMSVAKSFPKPHDHHKKSQFNIRYCVASALLNNGLGIQQFHEKEISDPRVTDLARRISVNADASLKKFYPKYARPSIVTIALADGRYITRRVDIPKGDPKVFPGETELLDKFRVNAKPVLGASDTEAAIRSVITDDFDGLFDILSRNGSSAQDYSATGDERQPILSREGVASHRIRSR